jgi:hypothetical protein
LRNRQTQQLEKYRSGGQKKKPTRKANLILFEIINMGDRSKIRERTSSATDKPEKPVAPASSATAASKELEDTAAIRNRLVVVNDRRVSTLTAKFFAFIRAAESDTTTLDEVYTSPNPPFHYSTSSSWLKQGLLGSQGTGRGPNPEGVRPV